MSLYLNILHGIIISYLYQLLDIRYISHIILITDKER